MGQWEWGRGEEEKGRGERYSIKKNIHNPLSEISVYLSTLSTCVVPVYLLHSCDPTNRTDVQARREARYMIRRRHVEW